jgi:alkanesulfonate monooxygenase SsuD/methylene tetrahydromethanopterin reductase-like flavin-dependent oxidoreductase (luciferase family)
LRDAILLPRPQRPGGPRVLIGGNGAKRTLSYVVRYADEWNCVALTAKELTDKNMKLDQMLHTAGRKPESVRRSMMTGCVFGKDEATLNQKVSARGRSLVELQQVGVIAGNLGAVKEQLRALEEAGLQRIMLQWLDLEDLASLEVLAKGVL